MESGGKLYRPDIEAGESRSLPLEVRTSGSHPRRLVGYAAVFNTETRIADSFTESIKPGAFSASLKSGSDILALADHDASKLLGRTKSGSLRLAEDSRGLQFELDVPPTTLGNDILALAERGDIGGMSFGFSTVADTWDGENRTLNAVTLHEISVVSAWPAYPDTTVAARFRLPRARLAARYVNILRGLHV